MKLLLKPNFYKLFSTFIVTLRNFFVSKQNSALNCNTDENEAKIIAYNTDGFYVAECNLCFFACLRNVFVSHPNLCAFVYAEYFVSHSNVLLFCVWNVFVSNQAYSLLPFLRNASVMHPNHMSDYIIVLCMCK